MSTVQYVGEFNVGDILGNDNPRYFLGLRRTDDGQLYFAKVDQITSTDTITVNTPGPSSQNYEDFEYGVDFFDGRSSVDHSRPYGNLFYDQYRWDNRNVFYYIDAQGELVIRINQTYSYS
jgi:hypothetical protein